MNNDITWAVDLINNGPNDANNIIASIPIPDGPNFISADTEIKRNMDLQQHNKNTNVEPRIHAKRRSSNTRLPNIHKQLRKHNNNSNKKPTEYDPVTTNNAKTRIIPIPNEIDIQVTQNVDNNTPTNGQTITYTINANNNGPTNATGISIQTYYQTDYILSANTHGAGTYNPTNGTWAIGNLNNGQTATLTITATVTNTNTITNTAKLQTKDQYDWNYNTTHNKHT